MLLFLKQIFLFNRSRFLRKQNLIVGSKSYIANNVQIIGLKNISIGQYCTIGEGSSITLNNRENNELRLTISDNVYIGRNNFFTIGKYMSINDYCIFGNNCSFLCSDHDFTNPLMPYALSGATDQKEIRIGANCWLGHNVSIVGHVTIGHGSVIGANSVVLNNIPPFSIAVGNPAKVIKRYSFTRSKWVLGKELDIDEEYISESNYIRLMKEKFGNTSTGFHSSSSKFGDL